MKKEIWSQPMKVKMEKGIKEKKERQKARRNQRDRACFEKEKDRRKILSEWIKRKLWLIDFNGMSIHLGLFYANRLGTTFNVYTYLHFMCGWLRFFFGLYAQGPIWIKMFLDIYLIHW